MIICQGIENMLACIVSHMRRRRQALLKPTWIFFTKSYSTFFLAALVLHWFSLIAASRGFFLVVVHGLIVAVASLVVEHGLQAHWLQQLQQMGSVVAANGLSSCGAWAQLLNGMWDLPGPEIKPESPALAGGFPCPVSPGKSDTAL